MTHSPFVLVAHMSAPLCLREPIHLDGVVLAAREKRFGPEMRGRPLDMLASVDGVFQASVGVIVTSGFIGVVKQKITRVRRLDMRGADGREINIPPDATFKERTIDSLSPYRNTLADETTYQGVTAVVFQALGDREAVEEIMSDEIRTLGKMHRTGWGAIDRFETWDCGAESETCGLIAGGAPMRNLPVAMAQKFGIDITDAYPARIEPPYALAADRQKVVGPTMADLVMVEHEARELLAY